MHGWSDMRWSCTLLLCQMATDAVSGTVIMHGQSSSSVCCVQRAPRAHQSVMQAPADPVESYGVLQLSLACEAQCSLHCVWYTVVQAPLADRVQCFSDALQAAQILRRCERNPKTGKTRGKCSPNQAYIVSGLCPMPRGVWTCCLLKIAPSSHTSKHRGFKSVHRLPFSSTVSSCKGHVFADCRPNASR